MFHMMFLLLRQCQRSKTQQKADANSMFHALDLNCKVYRLAVQTRKSFYKITVSELPQVTCRPSVVLAAAVSRISAMIHDYDYIVDQLSPAVVRWNRWGVAGITDRQQLTILHVVGMLRLMLKT